MNDDSGTRCSGVAAAGRKSLRMQGVKLNKCDQVEKEKKSLGYTAKKQMSK
jgi:hypothetical protein